MSRCPWRWFSFAKAQDSTRTVSPPFRRTLFQVRERYFYVETSQHTILHFLMLHNPFLFRWCHDILGGGPPFLVTLHQSLEGAISVVILAANPNRISDGESQTPFRWLISTAFPMANPGCIFGGISWPQLRMNYPPLVLVTLPFSSNLQWCLEFYQ